MADNSSSSVVAVIAILVIVILGVGVLFYATNGFKFDRTETTTIVQPNVAPASDTSR